MTQDEFAELLEDWEIRSQAVAYLKLRRELDAHLNSSMVIARAVEANELEGRTGRDAVLMTLLENTESARLALAELDEPQLPDFEFEGPEFDHDPAA